MNIVMNASPLIFLDKIGRLELLNELFEGIYIPKAVIQEIDTIKNQSEKVKLAKILYNEFEVLNKTAVAGLLGKLHLGEVEVIVGAIEQNIAVVVLDDNVARIKAKQIGLEVTGTLGILLRAKAKGYIDDISTDLDKLKEAGMYLSDHIIRQVLTS